MNRSESARSGEGGRRRTSLPSWSSDPAAARGHLLLFCEECRLPIWDLSDFLDGGIVLDQDEVNAVARSVGLTSLTRADLSVVALHPAPWHALHHQCRPQMRDLTDVTFRELTSPEALARRIDGLSRKTWIGLAEPVRQAVLRMARESLDRLVLLP